MQWTKENYTCSCSAVNKFLALWDFLNSNKAMRWLACLAQHFSLYKLRRFSIIVNAPPSPMKTKKKLINSLYVILLISTKRYTQCSQNDSHNESPWLPGWYLFVSFFVSTEPRQIVSTTRRKLNNWLRALYKKHVYGMHSTRVLQYQHLATSIRNMFHNGSLCMTFLLQKFI